MAELPPDEPFSAATRRGDCQRARTEDNSEQRGVFALFVDEDELRRRINPKMGRDPFHAAVREAEQHGFPKIHRLWRGRYWPAVQAWLDSDNGLAKNEFCANAEDGPEQF
jgi:hypothetical protein